MKGLYISNGAVLLLSSSCYLSKLRSLTLEDNLNNTFSIQKKSTDQHYSLIICKYNEKFWIQNINKDFCKYFKRKATDTSPHHSNHLPQA